MKPVRLGILGTGSVVRSCHLPALAGNPRVQLVAIGNLRAASLSALADEFHIPKVYTELERMADDGDIDAVVNALPNYLHAPWTIAMLKRGKHVLCEKPMATSVDEARGMVEAAGAGGRKLMIAHVWRSSPQVRWLRDVVGTGRLGTVYMAKAHCVVAGRGPRPDSWFVRRETAGGGALADVGIHGMDTISFLFGVRLKPLKVSARVSNNCRPMQVEDTADVLIEYDNGMRARVEAGWYHNHAWERHGAIELFGTEGYARTLPAGLYYRAGGGWSEQMPQIAGGHPDEDSTIYAAQLNNFLDCILKDCPPACDGLQGLRNMILLEAAYQSAASGRSVSPEPVEAIEAPT